PRSRPQSALFPYTTLFRSGEIMLVAENGEGGELKHPEEFNANVKPVEERDSLEEIIHRINERFPDEFSPQDRVIVETLHKAFTEDRKSTRLNSSHVSISYA